jgi:fatty acid desaturase
VGVGDSFWNSRVIAWVVGLCMFLALVTAFIMSWSCDGSFR